MTNKPIGKIAFIGTGLMGVPMILRLIAAGFDLKVWNRTPAKLEVLAAAGAEVASSPAAAATDTDAVLLCLSDAAAIEEVLFSKEGVSQARAPPSLVVDFSTIGPGPTRDLAKQLHARCKTSWIDAPVSGGVGGAEQGNLVIFCGGATADIDRAASIFAAVSQRYARIGGLGAGQTLKLCNQLIVGSNLVAIAESLALARSNNLDLTMLPQSLAGGFADSLPLQIFGRRMAAGVTRPILGELGLMFKDMLAVEGLARKNRCELPATNAALAIYRLAAERGLLREDLSMLFSLYPIAREAHPRC